MPTHYEILDPSVRAIVLKSNIDYKSYFLESNTGNYYWVPVPLTDLVTPEGVQWFIERGMELSKKAAIFKISAGAIGATHIDNSLQKIGFNFVMEGNMQIEWVDVTSPSHLSQYQIGDYINPSPDVIYPYPTIVEIKEVCTSTDAAIQVDSPHRGTNILGGNEDCYFISIRPNLKFQQANTYETIVALINNPV